MGGIAFAQVFGSFNIGSGKIGGNKTTYSSIPAHKDDRSFLNSACKPRRRRRLIRLGQSALDDSGAGGTAAAEVLSSGGTLETGEVGINQLGLAFWACSLVGHQE